MFRLLPFYILCYFFFFFFFFFFFPQTSSLSSNETDYLSLLAFRSVVDLDPLGALSSWNETTHFCSWNGIKCSLKHKHRVVAINLTSQGLQGSLSPHIGNLSLLNSIAIQNNSFHGSIPHQITLLKRLKYVEFSYNSFTGPIPQNISRCNNLSYLNFVENDLSGAIPAELGAMSKLEALGLGRNWFPGHIPPFLGNITTLTKLSLIGCGFVGEIPASFSHLKNLKFLQLAENSLTGTVPFSLFNFSSLRYFGVPNNNLHGSIPPNIGLTLPNLRSLDLFDNQFTGPIPPSISNASFLEIIQGYDNFFSGPLPRMGSQVHLYDFSFQRNLIADDDAGSFVSSFVNSSDLRFLDFGENFVTGSLPESVANLSKKIMVLSVGENDLGGKIPSGIGNLEGLAEFYASGSSLEGPIPEGIARLSNLRSLFLERNRFSDEELQFSFGNLTFLSRLHLNENNLSGNVPSSLANCSNLIELDLSFNNFHGFIPPAVLDLSSLSIVLNLSHNRLEGSIPNEVGSLRNLAALDLSNNGFSGAIPSSISECISLEKLYLNGNRFQGEIPLGFGGLIGLQELDLSMNNLSGEIPNLLGKLHLHKLNLSFNRLEGKVSTIGVFQNRTSISLEGNGGLCGGVSELELPPCPSSRSQEKHLSILVKILIPIMVGGGIFFVLFAVFIYKRMLKEKEIPSLPSPFGIQIMRLSYLDILKATDGFSERNLLGFGRYGSVYKAEIVEGDDDHDQRLMAVKVLDLSVRGASRSFIAECNALRNLRHRNLLKILSVCESIDSQGNEFMALVYEFKPNGSLEKWLHRRDEEGEVANNLNLLQRLNIAIDIAQAVEYLHFGTGSSIVHGDLKPSNILLDEDMTAHVGDFGLARIISDIVPLLQHEINTTSTGIRGTIGYLPPEYGMTYSLSTPGDVYSYGIVLLELFTNIRPTDDSFEDRVNLHRFVRDLLPDRGAEAVDPQLHTLMMNNNRMKECMALILSIGVSCSKEISKDRMCMKDVVIGLQMIQKLLSS